MKPILILLQALLTLSLLGQGSPATTATNGPAAHDFVRQHYVYLNDLAKRNDEHREFLWKSVKEMGLICIGLGSLLGGVAIFLGWKKNKTLKDHLAEHDKEINDRLAMRVTQLERALERRVAKVEEDAGKTFAKVIADKEKRWDSDIQGKVEERAALIEERLEERILGEIRAEETIRKLVQDADDAMRTPKDDGSYKTDLHYVGMQLTRHLLTTRPADLRIYIRLGVVLSRQDDFDGAIRWLREALTLPDDRPSMGPDRQKLTTQRMADVRFNLACYLNYQADHATAGADHANEVAGLREEAMTRLDEACAMDHLNVDCAKIDPQLRSLIEGRTWCPRTLGWVPRRNDV